MLTLKILFNFLRARALRGSFNKRDLPLFEVVTLNRTFPSNLPFRFHLSHQNHQILVIP
jgi:hypothetical protein